MCFLRLLLLKRCTSAVAVRTTWASASSAGSWTRPLGRLSLGDTRRDSSSCLVLNARMKPLNVSLQDVHVRLPGWPGGPAAVWDVPGPGDQNGGSLFVCLFMFLSSWC